MSTESKVIERNSIGMFDISRGILMISVVLAHSITQFVKYWEPQYTQQWWYCFLIFFKPVIYGVLPMFFIMSGYGFRPKPVGKCIKERVKYILKPYILVGLITTGLYVIKEVVTDHSALDALVYQGVPFILGLCPGGVQLGSWYLGSIGPIWFLVVLTLSWIGLDMICKLENEYIRMLCIGVMCLICTRLPFIGLIPFCIIQSVCCIAYLYVGYMMRKSNTLLQKMSGQSLIVMLVIAIPAMVFGNIEVSQNVWALGIFDFIASVIIGVLMLKLSCYCNRFTGKISNSLRVVGKYSLYILCVHTIEYLAFPWGWINSKLWNHKVLGIIVAFVIRGLVIAGGCWLIQRYTTVRRKKRRLNKK